jgi:hypothetical protein
MQVMGMQQVNIEIPLDTLPKGVIPKELLQKASVIRFLHLDFNRFLFICRVPKNELEPLLSFLKKHYRQMQKEIDVSHEGREIIRVSGQWANGKMPKTPPQNGTLEKLKAIYQSRAYFLRSPEISGACLRITLVGEPDSLRKLLEVTFSRAKLQYRITKLCGLEKSIDTPFDRLTIQQMRVIRLAYEEGYYSVPRKINTEKLAKLLKMDKGTVGEHLRRAERNIMDSLMMS